MFELTGQAVSLGIDCETGKANLTFEINEKEDILGIYDELRGSGKLSLKLAKFRKKRSLNANAYAWKLMGDIAENQGISPNEVYRHQIREAGISRVIEIEAAGVKTLEHSWGMLGLGWFCERLDFGRTKGFALIRLYYGSSSYDTKQMSRLLESIISDCQALGIPTETPKEIENMLSLWDSQ